MWIGLWWTACDADPGGRHRPEAEPTGTPARWYPDLDHDGYGAADGAVDEVDPPSGFVPEAGDCGPLDPSVHPGAQERCDPVAVDDDCDGRVDAADDDVVDLNVFWADADGDGLGDPNAPVTACDPPPGTVLNAADCAESVPFGFDWADGTDNDCDGVVDVQAIHVPQRWFFGADRLAGDALVTDVDGDGCADVVAAVHAGTGFAQGGLVGLLDAGASLGGDLFVAADWVVEGNISMARSGWDGDGDGVLDLVVADWTAGRGYTAWWLGGLRSGTEAVEDAAWARYDQETSWLGPTGDFDGDGALDLVIFANDLEDLALFDAAWTAGNPVPYRALRSSFGFGHGAGDLDGDGIDDLVHEDGLAQLVVRFGSPALRDPTAPVERVVVRDAGVDGVAVADLDGDGVAELVVSAQRGASGVLRAFPGDLLRLGVAQVSWELEVDDPMILPTVGDFDGDGTDDLAVGLYGAGADRVGILRGGPQVAGALDEADLDLVSDAPVGGIIASLAAGDLDHNNLDELVVGFHGAFGLDGHFSVLPGAAPGPCIP